MYLIHIDFLHTYKNNLLPVAFRTTSHVTKLIKESTLLSIHFIKAFYTTLCNLKHIYIELLLSLKLTCPLDDL